MTKANITQYSSTASSNQDIDDININEGCPASGLNNAIRSLMAHLKNVDTGTQALTALTVTGVGTFGSLDISGNIDVDGTTNLDAVDIDGDVNIQGAIQIGASDNDKRSKFQGNNQYRISLRNGTTDQVYLGSGGANNFRVSNNSGATLLELTSASNVLLPTSGAGIYLGVTSEATSNLLDDFETGSFTPAYSQSGGDTLRTGRYTKVGNMVTIFIRAQYNQTNSTTALGKITGLPFTILNETGLTTAIFREFSSTGALFSTSINPNTTETNEIRRYDNAATFTAGHELGVGLEFSYRVA